jgi:hypothetical protein
VATLVSTFVAARRNIRNYSRTRVQYLAGDGAPRILRVCDRSETGKSQRRISKRSSSEQRVYHRYTLASGHLPAVGAATGVARQLQ